MIHSDKMYKQFLNLHVILTFVLIQVTVRNGFSPHCEVVFVDELFPVIKMIGISYQLTRCIARQLTHSISHSTAIIITLIEQIDKM